MKAVALRIGSVSPPVSLVNSDGYNFYNLGDIPAGQNVAKADAGFGWAAGGFRFRAYITQKKETVTQGVLDAGASGPASSLFNFKSATSRSAAPRSISPSRVVTTGAISQGASTSLKLDSSGNPKVAYTEVDLYDLKYAYWDGSAWQRVTVDGAGKTGFYSSLALTSLGNPRIAYYSKEDSSNNITQDLKFAFCNAACNDPANWGTVTIDSNGDVGGHTSIALDSAGNPRISYYDFTTGYLKYAYCDSGAACDNALNWTTMVIDSAANVGMYTSLVLDSSGNPRISYYDFTNGDLKFAYCDTACNDVLKWTKIVVDSTNANVGGYTSLALDPATGNARVSYYDFTNGNLKYAMLPVTSAGLNLSEQQLLNTGGGNNEDFPFVMQLPNGRYRLYYSYRPVGGYYQLVYQDTTDTNPPACTSGPGTCTGTGGFGTTNLDTQQTLGIGGSAGNLAYSPFVIQLADGTYRLYYTYNSGYAGLFYRDTTGVNKYNPPDGTNLGAQQTLNTGGLSSYVAMHPDVIRLPNGKYRVYYARYVSNPELAYKETTNINPPDSANLGAPQYLGIGGAYWAWSVSFPEK